MPNTFGGDVDVTPETSRARDWPCLRQFCVFMENRVGRLHDLLRQVERHDLRVLGLSVVDTVDFAVARVIVDQTDRARELLLLSNFTVIETDVLGVHLGDSPQPFVEIYQSLMTAEINVHYTYPMLYRRDGRGAIVLHVDDIDQATSILRSRNHRLLTEGDLLDDDEYF